MMHKGAGGRTVVMQPYMFPYLGYVQLFHACDRFISLDDAAYIRQGWINRNRILLNGAAHTFTIPLQAQSSFVPICGTMVAVDNGWRRKLISTIDQAYRKAPHHAAVLHVVESVLGGDPGTIDELAERSLRAVLTYMGVERPMTKASTLGVPLDLKAQDRVIALCEAVGTSTYINAAGGRELYSSSDFSAHGIELRFIRMSEVRYPQRAQDFVPGLSIIDVLMWNSPEQARTLLEAYTLEP